MEKDVSAIIEKVKKIERSLKSKYSERDEIIDSVFAAIISGQHLLMIGPPGTAKSEMVLDISHSLDNAKYFSMLLTEFTTPQEIFGPYSFTSLKEDILARKTTNFLPDAEVAFIDEIFKASSAILNTLLTIINERVFYDNGKPVDVPLLTLFAASNEYPNSEDGVAALYDRFLFRFTVDYIVDDKIFMNLLYNKFNGDSSETFSEKLSIEEVLMLRAAADEVVISDTLYNAYALMRKALDTQGVKVSDRRYIWALKALKSYALLNGESQVTEKYFRYLTPMLWNEESEIPIVEQVIEEHLDIVRHKIEKLTKQTDSILNAFTPDITGTARINIINKLAVIVKELEVLNSSEATELAESIKEQAKFILKKNNEDGAVNSNYTQTKSNVINLGN